MPHRRSEAPETPLACPFWAETEANLQVTKEEYTSVGSEKLGQQLERQLRAKGLNPVVIPVGGSNSLGTWGYIEAMNEISAQTSQDSHPFTDIAMVISEHTSCHQ